MSPDCERDSPSRWRAGGSLAAPPEADRHITADDLAAVLMAFASSLAFVMAPAVSRCADDLLEALANEIDSLAKRVPRTTAGLALEITARMLMASETH